MTDASVKPSSSSPPTLALDPGGTIGYASWDGAGYEVGHVAPEDVWMFVSLFLDSWDWGVVVMEDFKYRTGQKAADLTPVKVIGVVEELCRQRNATLVMQSPSQAKFYFTDDRLKKAELWVKGKPHGMDALRHLLFFRKDFLL